MFQRILAEFFQNASVFYSSFVLFVKKNSLLLLAFQPAKRLVIKLDFAPLHF